MHLQASTPNWTEALVQMPDGYLLKSVQNSGILLDGYEKWVAAGRDPNKLTLDFRHEEMPMPLGNWENLKNQWRANFWRFVDGTYLERYAPFVHLVEECNEYFTNQSVIEEGITKYINSAAAAVAVWNEEFRGKRVLSPDGGSGQIRDDCRLVLANGFVTHDIPREYYQLAVESDSVIGYHNYTRYDNGVRAPDDWPNHSGRVFRLEQAYGLKPRYAFTECGPYNSAEAGWRHPSVLNANVPALVEALRRVVHDMQATDAYREGRIFGPGAYFTVGHVGWEFYQLDTPELKAIAAMLRQEWHPGEYDMDEELKEAIRLHAQAILDLLADPPWWQRPTPYTFTAQPNPALKLYNENRTLNRTTNYTGWPITVRETEPTGWLRITGGDVPTDTGLWMQASDVTPA